ncbi:hypothetical protein H4R99_000616 [Coemansia sp. RSA 1722]|nr:hypothetical protein IWW45_000499 [Coemansia sp. RSA 485]KAJ2606063.1 hypothetical protein H4R99_000616 [Coemansia sp. RSA 1722]
MSSWLQRGLFTRRRTGSTASTATQQADEPKSPAPTLNSSTPDSPNQLLHKDTDSVAEIDLGPAPLDQELEDVDGLFSRLSVAEMRQYDQRLQRHMEHMRRQMRKVAADHYPELIDAADSVVAMDGLSASISMQMSRLRGMLEDAQQAGQKDASTDETRKHVQRANDSADDAARDRLYAVAAQVKVLVDTPELVWKALAARHFLQASLLYLIAREIHQRLGSVSEPGGGNDDDGVEPMLAFPVIERMWTTVAPLAVQIADKARLMLGGADDASTEACMSAICAIALLEDVDAEVASAEFLARRGEALAPLLARVEAAETGPALEKPLCELLGHVHQIVADYVLIFGVPDDHRAYASWMATTLASICADAELALHPALRLLWDATAAPLQQQQPPPPLSGRRSEMQSLKARRRKSSIAGSVLSTTVLSGSGPPVDAPTTPKIGTHAFSDARRPWRAAAAAQGGAATLSSNVIVARHLPAAVARFCPPLARVLDVQWEATGDALDEADEENDMQGLAQHLGDPRALARALATHVQPIVERCARRSLRLWWQATAKRVQAVLKHAINKQVMQVADATRVARVLAAWETDMLEARRWTRGFAWHAIAGNALVQDVAAQSLSRELVEPLLRARASELQHKQVEAALSLADTFVRGNADVCAGHLPWRALGDASGSSAAAGVALRELAADVRGSLAFRPAGVRELETRVWSRIEAAWVDAQTWWAQLSGAAAAPEALACARHFAQHWDLLVGRLERWADDCVAAANGNDDALVIRCVRGAWATVALAGVARRVLAPHAAHLVGACWGQAGVDEDRLVQRLQIVGRALLRPWQRALGSGLARAWVSQFDALYYRVPHELRADAAATRQDVVRAWRRADAPWSTRYQALRRLAIAADQPAQPQPSEAVRCLSVAVLAQVQAVGGLSAGAGGLLADGQRAMRRCIGEVAGDELTAAAAVREKTGGGGLSEWDGRQIAVDIRFVLHGQLGVDDDTARAVASECEKAVDCAG